MDAAGAETTPVSCCFLHEDDLSRLATDAISQLSALLSDLSESEARILLLHHKWDIPQAVHAWSDNEPEIRRQTSLCRRNPELPEQSDAIQTCGICLETCSEDRPFFKPSFCDDHFYCVDCCKSYIRTQIRDGPGCLDLRCPEPNCSAPVLSKTVEQLATEDDKDKFYRYLVMSYVDGKKHIKWCPAPGCEIAVSWPSEVVVERRRNLDVSCSCTHRFCWNCLEEPHRPVDCETAACWLVNNSEESENIKYILEFTKPCPRCKRPIEKFDGCAHMMCRSCGCHFCWQCLRNECGGCRVQEREAKRRKLAAEEIDPQSHFYNQWEANMESVKKAVEDLKVREEKIGEEFICEAWRQMIECRRVLQWTYPYGYYLRPRDKERRLVLGELQEQIQSDVKRFDAYLERVKEGMMMDGRSGFDELREEVKGLTRKTRTTLQGLINALLPDSDGGAT